MPKSVLPRKVNGKWEVEDEVEFDRLSKMTFLERNLYEAEQAVKNPRKHVLDNDDLARMSVPSEFWSFTKGGVTANVRKPVSNYDLNFATFEKEGTGIYLYGEPGRGKTGAAVTLLRVARENYRSGFFIRVAELRDALQRESGGRGGFDADALIGRRVRTVNFLVLDSLVLGDLTLPYFKLEDLINLVAFRGENHLPTVVTSVLDPNDVVFTQSGFFEILGKFLLALEVTGENRRSDSRKQLGKLLRGEQ